jgi:hypothetical protein
MSKIRRYKSEFPNIVSRLTIKKPFAIKDELLINLGLVNSYLEQKLNCDCFMRFRPTAKCPNPLCRVFDVKKFAVQAFPIVKFHSDES